MQPASLSFYVIIHYSLTVNVCIGYNLIIPMEWLEVWWFFGFFLLF